MLARRIRKIRIIILLVQLWKGLLDGPAVRMSRHSGMRNKRLKAGRKGWMINKEGNKGKGCLRRKSI
jgi:hypothetical protein